MTFLLKFGSWRRSLSFLKCRISTAAVAKSNGYKNGRVDKLDEGLKLGDYPNLPWRSAQELPAKGWWDEQDRRNKEDPLHEQDDMLNMWVCDYVENNGRYTRWEALGQLTVAFSFLGLLYGLSILYDAPSRRPCVPRQFPFDNLYASTGGDPSKPPTEESKQRTIQSTYGEIVS